MQRQFDVCVIHERLLDALEIMSATGDDRVPVVVTRETMAFAGIITAQQAAMHLGLTDRRPSEVMCREVVAPAPVVLSPRDDLAQAAALRQRFEIQRLPVVEEGKLVGLVLATDLAAALARATAGA